MKSQDAGTWTCFYKHKYDEWHVAVPATNSSGMKVALFPDGVPGDTLEERAGLARLISAAPDLLEACKKARQFIENGVEFGFIRMPDDDTPDEAHNMLPSLLAAIEKAEGGAREATGAPGCKKKIIFSFDENRLSELGNMIENDCEYHQVK